jgi:DinB superfamily
VLYAGGGCDEEGYRRASLARGEAVGGLLDTIVAEHEQLARLLQALSDADWPRQGRHPSLGVMSIEFLARRVGEHAEEHAAQIAEATGTGRARGTRAGD